MEELINAVASYVGTPNWTVSGVLGALALCCLKLLVRPATRLATRRLLGEHLPIGPEACEILRLLEAPAGWKLAGAHLTHTTEGGILYVAVRPPCKVSVDRDDLGGLNRRERRLIAQRTVALASLLQERDREEKADRILHRLRGGAPR